MHTPCCGIFEMKVSAQKLKKILIVRQAVPTMQKSSNSYSWISFFIKHVFIIYVYSASLLALLIIALVTSAQIMPVIFRAALSRYIKIAICIKVYLQTVEKFL